MKDVDKKVVKSVVSSLVSFGRQKSVRAASRASANIIDAGFDCNGDPRKSVLYVDGDIMSHVVDDERLGDGALPGSSGEKMETWKLVANTVPMPTDILEEVPTTAAATVPFVFAIPGSATSRPVTVHCNPVDAPAGVGATKANGDDTPYTGSYDRA